MNELTIDQIQKHNYIMMIYLFLSTHAEYCEEKGLPPKMVYAEVKPRLEIIMKKYRINE